MMFNLENISPLRIAAKDSHGNSIKYGDITELASNINKCITKRSLIFILTENNVGGIVWTISSILSGHVPLILNAHIDPQLLNKLIQIYQPTHICEPISQTQNINSSVINNYGYILYKTGFDNYQMFPELSHLLPTSGSTGSPKLIRHKYSNIEAAALNISTLFRLTERDRPLMVLPIYYTMGLSIIFSHLKVGATILITDCKMTDPLFWKFFKEEKATSFTGVPFSYEILDKMRFYRMNLPSLNLLTQGGGKMSEDLNLKFVNYCLQSGKRWIATYGQSEGTARMAWLPEEYSLSKIGSIGIAVPNGQLSLIDPDGNEIVESPAFGEMCYTGKNVTMGYAEHRDDLKKGDERHGFLKTGDLAYRDKDGFYFIKGRMGRFIKLYGNRIGLDECEILLKSKLTCDCACMGNDNEIIVYVTDFQQAKKATQTLMETVNLPANVITIRHIVTIPKNETGKTLYSKLENI